MKAARQALDMARRGDSVQPTRRADSSAFVLVRDLRSRVAALHNILRAHARAEELTSNSRELRGTLDALFQGKSTFVRNGGDELIVGSEVLVERAKERTNADVLERVGADAIMKTIGVATTALVEARSRQAHARPPSDPSVVDLYQEVIKAVRAYVEIVEGAHRVGLVDGTMLLAPLTNLPARRRRSKDAPKSTPKAVDTKEPVTDSDEDDAPSSRAA